MFHSSTPQATPFIVYRRRDEDPVAAEGKKERKVGSGNGLLSGYLWLFFPQLWKMDENGPQVDDKHIKHDDLALKNGDISGNMMGCHWTYPLLTLVQTWHLEIPEPWSSLVRQGEKSSKEMGIHPLPWFHGG